jgi:hypothetical protein
MLKRFINSQPLVLFILLSLLIFLWQGYAAILQADPAGTHFIRQTDGLSFLLRYYLDGSGFLEPAIFNLLSENGRAASEFPLLYYTGALVARITGYHPAILRILDFIIVFSGLCGLFLLYLRLLGNFFLSFTGSWLSFSSILFFFYAGNFLPDMPALGFCLCGWYAVCLFWQSGKYRHLVAYSLFFLLSGLLKVTFLVHAMVVPLALLLFLRPGDYLGGFSKRQLLQRSLAACVIVLALCASWYIYARHYNSLYEETYFLVKARPLWTMSRADILLAWEFLSDYWLFTYYHPYLWLFFLFLFIFNLSGFSRYRDIFSGIYLLLFGASLGILVLFFAQYTDHDYYFIVFLPFFSFLILSSLLHIGRRFPRLYRSAALKAVFLLLLYKGQTYARTGVERRFQEKDMFSAAVSPVKEYASFLSSLGIKEDEKPLLLGDPTYNGGLYHLQRKGIPMVFSGAFPPEGVERLVVQNRLTFAISLRNHDFGDLEQRLRLSSLLESDSIRIYRIGIR